MFSFYIGLGVLCLTRLSFAEPPIAPYPAAGPPSGPSFSHGQGGSNQFQDLPEVIAGRLGGYNDQANHRIHFNLFKDHETKKNKDNISFKLGQGEGPTQSGGNQDFRSNFQGSADNGFSSPSSRNDLSQKFGASQTNNLNRNYGTPNQQSLVGQQQNDLSARYGPPSQSYDRLSSSDLFQKDLNQGKTNHGSFQQGYNSDYKSATNEGKAQSFSDQRYTPQTQQQYGPPQTASSHPNFNQNKPSDAYGPPSSFRTQGNSPQQFSSSNRASTQLQQTSQPRPTYGVPKQGHQQYKNMDNQQRNQQFNSLDRYNNQHNQGGAIQTNNFNSEGQSSEGMTERANYEYEYEVRGEQSHGHEESREGDEAWGSYRVELPDGRTMLVEYTADDRGYRPKITYTDQQSDQVNY